MEGRRSTGAAGSTRTSAEELATLLDLSLPDNTTLERLRGE